MELSAPARFGDAEEVNAIRRGRRGRGRVLDRWQRLDAHVIPFPPLHPLSNDPLAFKECNPHLQHLHSQRAYHAEVLRTLICGAFFYMLDAWMGAFAL